ncbi:hypothetical protein Tco_0045793 [Tanacetum coccineum]
MVAGKKILISEETIRADLLFDDAHGVDCFPKQVIWDLLRDIGYEGNLAQLTFSKPLFSPQWKYLVHVLLHCLSPKSTSWEQFGTNIASALVGLATNQKFNFSLMIMNGMLGHISNGTPFLMYPRITPLTPPMLEVVTALAAEEEHSTSRHSMAQVCKGCQCTPTQSALKLVLVLLKILLALKRNEGLLDFYALTRKLSDSKRQTLTQAKQISRSRPNTKIVKDGTTSGPTSPPWYLKSQKHKKKKKRKQKKQEEKVSSVKLGRNTDKGTLSEEHYVQDDYTVDPFFKDIVDKDVVVTPDLERKSDETEEINIEEKKASDVKSGDTEELDFGESNYTRQRPITPKDPKILVKKPQEFKHSCPIQSQPQPQHHLKLLNQMIRRKELGRSTTKKKKLTLQQIRAIETTNDAGKVARKIHSECGMQKQKEKVEELKKPKPKTA